MPQDGHVPGLKCAAGGGGGNPVKLMRRVSRPLSHLFKVLERLTTHAARKQPSVSLLVTGLSVTQKWSKSTGDRGTLWRKVGENKGYCVGSEGFILSLQTAPRVDLTPSLESMLLSPLDGQSPYSGPPGRPGGEMGQRAKLYSSLLAFFSSLVSLVFGVPRLPPFFGSCCPLLCSGVSHVSLSPSCLEHSLFKVSVISA